jgi:hypothetical protein
MEFMKGIVLSLLMLSNLLVFGVSSDTTVTSFEIHLKRISADSPLGFNTCSIDRDRIYNFVMEKVKEKLASENLTSLYNPQVTMKFHDVTGKVKRRDQKSILPEEEKSLKNRTYNYFVKVYGNLDIDSPLNQYQKATFDLKVFIFDRDGNLVHKCKSRSRDRNVGTYGKAEIENNPITEQEFFELVNLAAQTLKLRM